MWRRISVLILKTTPRSRSTQTLRLRSLASTSLSPWLSTQYPYCSLSILEVGVIVLEGVYNMMWSFSTLKLFQEALPGGLHGWEDHRSCVQSSQRDISDRVEPLGLAGHSHAHTEHLWRLSHLHHDDQLLHCWQLHQQVKKSSVASYEINKKSQHNIHHKILWNKF